MYGPPRVYAEAVAVEGAAGEDARLEVSLCGEPRPEVKWDLGLVVLTPGSRHGRFVTDVLVGVPGSLHCYRTTLYIVGAVPGSSCRCSLTQPNPNYSSLKETDPTITLTKANLSSSYCRAQ